MRRNFIVYSMSYCRNREGDGFKVPLPLVMLDVLRAMPRVLVIIVIDNLISAMIEYLHGHCLTLSIVLGPFPTLSSSTWLSFEPK
jgi:hypothetical protein